MEHRVHVPTPLRSYTGQESTVDAAGGTLGEVLATLNDRYPGIRFRMIDEQDRVRPHIKLFVNDTVVEDLTQELKPADTITIVAALSGG